MTCCCCCSSSSLIVISVLGLLVILSRAIGAKRNLNGDSNSGPCHRRHPCGCSSNIRVDPAAAAIATKGESLKEMAEADKDAMDRALPLPAGSAAMEACTMNISVMTRMQLVELCSAYRLPCNGEQARVEVPPSGPQRRSKTLAEVLLIPDTERSRDNRTPEEKDAVLEWAHRIVAKYPYKKREEDQNRAEGKMLAMASVPATVDLAVQQLGGSAQFERIAHALGWTPPGSTCRPRPGDIPPMCDSAQSWDDNHDMPMETDCPAADSDLADL